MTFWTRRRGRSSAAAPLVHEALTVSGRLRMAWEVQGQLDLAARDRADADRAVREIKRPHSGPARRCAGTGETPPRQEFSHAGRACGPRNRGDYLVGQEEEGLVAQRRRE